MARAAEVRLAEHYFGALNQGLLRLAEFFEDRAVLEPAIEDMWSEVAEFHDCQWVLAANMKFSGHWERAAALEEQIPQLHARLARRIQIYDGPFIGYRPDRETVAFFSDLTRAQVDGVWGWDEFPPEARFGGIAFRKFTDHLFHLWHAALMHAHHVEAAVGAGSPASAIDLLPMPLSLTQCEYRIREWCTTGAADAAQIHRCTSLGPWNWQDTLKMPRGAASPCYSLGNEHVLFSFAGCTSNPVDFLLGELERNFPDDWTRNAAAREEILRNQIITLLSSHEDVIAVPRTIMIDTALGETDLDLAMIDQRAGVLALFQLKWQRMLGANLRARRTQGGNLLKSANRWVERTLAWRDGGRMQECLSSAGFGKRAAESIKECRIFVLGRHVGRISGGETPHAGAAWGNSWQMRRLLISGQVDKADPLRTLHDKLREEGPARGRPPGQVEDLELELSGLHLTIRRE